MNIETKKDDADHSDDDVLSKRPWSKSAKEISFMGPDGLTRKCWMLSVVDANGNVICFGKSADMKKIVELENLDYKNLNKNNKKDR